MSFLWPAMLLLIPAIPLGVLLYARRERRRRDRAAMFGGTGASQVLTAGRPGSFRRRLPGALIVVGLTAVVLALARPQSVVSVPRVEGTVILAFDVSGSMAADDLQPTRMEAAKTAARAFVAEQPASILIGVVAFSDGGFSIQVPTADDTAVLAAIDRLAPERGTSIGRGIEASLTTIVTADALPTPSFYTDRSPVPEPSPTSVPAGTYAPAVIVLLTDGENTQSPDPLGAAKTAAERGVRIFTVGLGSTAGVTLEVEGFKVHSRLDEALLQQISEMTGGAYYAAADTAALRSVYDNIETHLVVRSEPMEVTSLFVGAGMLLLLVGGLCSLAWLGRLP